MIKTVLLDSGPLGVIAHVEPDVAIASWVRSLLAAGHTVVIPEVADFEVRRELIRAGKTKSVRRLDNLQLSLEYLPISTPAMLMAAEIWARMRNLGRPTGAPDSLDADAILAGQANAMNAGGRSVVVATDNVKHLDQMTHAEYWHNILVGS